MRPVEHVAEYPRPPLIELVDGSVQISIAGEVIAQDRHFNQARSTPQRAGLPFVNGKAFRRIGISALLMGANVVFVLAGAIPIQRNRLLLWPVGSAFIPNALTVASWRE